MAKQKLSSFKDLAILVGMVPTVQIVEKPQKKKVKPTKKVTPPTVENAADLKSVKLPDHLKPKQHRPAPDKVVVHKDPGSIRITPQGQKEVGKATQQGTSDLGRFKLKLDQVGLELHGTQVRRKKTFVDEVCHTPDTAEQIKLVKDYQGFFDDEFRRKA